MNFAILRGLGAGNIDFRARRRTIGGRELQRLRVNEHRLYAGRGIEVLGVAISGKRCGADHEVGPDGSGGGTAEKAEVAIVVETDPDHTKQIGSETSEPAVVRSAGFTSGGESEAAGAHTGAGTVVEDIFQHAGHEIRNARVESEARLRGDFLEGLAVSTNDIADELRLGARAPVGEGGIACGDVNRRHFVRAKSDGRGGANVRAKAHLPRDLHHAAVTDQLGHFYGGHV